MVNAYPQVFQELEDVSQAANSNGDVHWIGVSDLNDPNAVCSIQIGVSVCLCMAPGALVHHACERELEVTRCF